MKHMKLVILGIALVSVNARAFYCPGQGRWLSRDPAEEACGANLYIFCGNDPISFVDFLGLLSSSEALAHYRTGTDDPKNPNRRTPLGMSFDEIDTSKVKVEKFKKIAEQLKSCTPGTYQIKWGDKFDSLPFLTSGDQALFLGNISLKLEGTIVIRKGGDWEFSGQLKSFDDLYDFNASTHRGAIGEALTWLGREQISGKPYYIEIRGAKQASATGNCCEDKTEAKEKRRKWY